MAQLPFVGKLYNSCGLKLTLKCEYQNRFVADQPKPLQEYFNDFVCKDFPQYLDSSNNEYAYFISGSVVGDYGQWIEGTNVYLMAKNTGKILRTAVTDYYGGFTFHNIPEKPYNQTEDDWYMVIAECPKNIPCNSMVYDKIKAVPYHMQFIDPDNAFSLLLHDDTTPYYSIEGACSIYGGFDYRVTDYSVLDINTSSYTFYPDLNSDKNLQIYGTIYPETEPLTITFKITISSYSANTYQYRFHSTHTFNLTS